MKTNNPDYLTASSGTTHLQTDLTSNMETKTNQTADNGATTIQGTTADNSAILVSETTKPNVGTTIDRLTTYNDKGTIAIPYTPTENPKLKNATQQKRVELIETQKWEIVSLNATIDNLKLDVKTLSERAETIINDLSFRNGNLTRITNDQTERIEVMQNELKNYESVVEVYENRISNFKTENKWLQNDISNLKTKNEMQTESRERLASKLTNWFLFLVTVIIIEAVFLVKMALENGSKP